MISQVMYDPFVPGRFTVAERSTQAFDAARNRSFPCDVWRPTEPVGVCPVILLSRSSGGSGRRGYTFLTNHLASHGYIVAGLKTPNSWRPSSDVKTAKRLNSGPREPRPSSGAAFRTFDSFSTIF